MLLQYYHQRHLSGMNIRENVYLYDMQVSTCLVGAYEDYNCFGEVGFFVVSRFQNWTKSSD
jgi:hypothetical protein